MINTIIQTEKDKFASAAAARTATEAAALKLRTTLMSQLAALVVDDFNAGDYWTASGSNIGYAHSGSTGFESNSLLRMRQKGDTLYLHCLFSQKYWDRNGGNALVQAYPTFLMYRQAFDADPDNIPKECSLLTNYETVPIVSVKLSSEGCGYQYMDATDSRRGFSTIDPVEAAVEIGKWLAPQVIAPKGAGKAEA